MAQKKTSTGRTAAKKPSTSSRSGGTKKKTASASGARKSTGGSRGSAAKKAPAKTGSRSAAASRSTSARTNTASRSGGSRAAAAPRYERPMARQIGAVALLFVGLIAVIAYFPVDGWLIGAVRKLFFGLSGWGFYLWPVCILWAAGILGFHQDKPAAVRVTCVLCLPLVFGAFIHALLCAREGVFVSGMGYGLQLLWRLGQDVTEHCGGVIGGTVGIALKTSIGLIGSFIVLVVAFLLLLLKGLDLSAAEIVDQLQNREKPDEDYALDPDEYDDDDDYPFSYEPEPRVKDEDVLFPMDGGKRYRVIEPPPVNMPAPKKAAEPAPKKPRRNFYDQSREADKEQLFADFDVDPDALAKVNAALAAKTAKQKADKSAALRSEAKKKAAGPTEDVKPLTVEEAADIAGVEIHSGDMDSAAAPGKPEKLKIDKDAEAAAVAQEIETAAAEDKPEYVFPPVDLLNASGDERYDTDDADGMEEQLESAVRSFGVGASVVGAVHGPTITRYELKLDQGVKLNKITNLAGDIALSLGVKSVRIAPVPDKISTVGVEVPNKTVRTVWLGDLVDSPVFRESKNKLTVALGRDIGGNVVVSNIAKMPHLLIAGTTGSGKSVCVNSMILSLLYKSTPDEVRMIMIDPKMVEFVVYNGMPHLYVPVVTDAKKAAGALQWAVVEMLKRYRLFSETGVRELQGYNALMKERGEQTLPQVVIFIDELADLMMVASKEVEEAICRVAQMGRAAGMHLVIATQSPRADVITGLMKANIPSRIALSVSGPLESRIILDQQGAEKLLGNGDMLYSPIGSKPVRLQGAFVTDEEREEIINFVKKEAEAEYSDEILAEIEKAAADKDSKNAPAEEESSDKGDYDELLPQAVDVIFETKQASVSMLQRRLKLGYSRAARLIDQLEEVGVVGPYEGSKPRQIVITKQQWQEMQYAHGTAPVDTIAREFAEVSESDEFAPTAEEEPEEKLMDGPDNAGDEGDDGEDDLL